MQSNVFSDCLKYILDPFWIEIVQECANGRFPKGIIYNAQRNTLRNHEGVFDIPSHPKDLKTLLLKLFRSVGLKSPKDLKIEKDAFVEENELQTKSIVLDQGWKKIKPRSMKETFILNYVCDMAKILKLSSKERDRLYKLISIGIFTKVIDGVHIVYENKKITFIENVDFCSKTRQFSFCDTNVAPQKTYRQTRKTLFCQRLGKFIKTIREKAKFDEIAKDVENVEEAEDV